MTRENMAINLGGSATRWHRRADTRLGPPLSARAVRSDMRGRG